MGTLKKKRTYAGYTKARAQANSRYLAKFDNVSLRLTKIEHEKLKTLAKAENLSVAKFIKKKIFS